MYYDCPWLTKVNLPTTKGNILSQLRELKIPEGVIQALCVEELPDKTYLTMQEILAALAKIRTAKIEASRKLEHQLKKMEGEIRIQIISAIPWVRIEQLLKLYNDVVAYPDQDLIDNYNWMNKEWHDDIAEMQGFTSKEVEE